MANDSITSSAKILLTLASHHHAVGTKTPHISYPEREAEIKALMPIAKPATWTMFDIETAASVATT